MFDSSRIAGLWFLNSHVMIGLSNKDNPDGISVIRHRTPFGDAPPLHIHHGEDEIFHIISGALRFKVGDRTMTAKAGETVIAPRDIPHAFRVISPDGAEFVTVTRGGFENMVRSVSRLAPAIALPIAVDPTPEMQADLVAKCAAERIEIIGPPID